MATIDAIWADMKKGPAKVSRKVVGIVTERECGASKEPQTNKRDAAEAKSKAKDKTDSKV